MYKYVYNGTTEVAIKGVGVVKPGQAIETNTEINNKLFEVTTDELYGGGKEKPKNSKKKRK